MAGLYEMRSGSQVTEQREEEEEESGSVPVCLTGKQAGGMSSAR